MTEKSKSEEELSTMSMIKNKQRCEDRKKKNSVAKNSSEDSGIYPSKGKTAELISIFKYSHYKMPDPLD